MKTARQWSIAGLGPQDLRIREAEIAAPGVGEMVVRTEAVSLNFRDKLVMENGMGLPLAFPFVPVSDMAGVVEAVGTGVTRFKPGDRVISTFMPGRLDGNGLGNARNPPYRTLGGAHPGVLSEYVTFPADWFVAAPKTLDAGEASTLPCAGLTAWMALIESGHLKAGDKVLVQGTGGVALFAVQIARAHGAEIFVTSSSAEKLERVRGLGVKHLLARDGWVDGLLDLTDGYGADHVLDIAGGSGFAQSLKAVAVGGRISLIGVFGGLEISGSAPDLLLKAPIVQGISVGHRRALEDFVLAVDVVGLKPVIDRRYRFEEAAEAFAHLDRGPFGKIVIEF
ncbi:NAD(P)-dependent alcohol dehydrogenase [Phyllobacterium salinisoli]|uniref:NAD(P)-dependent alcohol dehydrogenase n=1 Tax=Phyllobacterium salinisoli TaxID=1899321 RepID=A0A368JXC2_9HYPH|nr:NAD(P)-dependent alcohol dehydrogenase [Phyllobacterium salinisoli]RCS21601.1 NAD(P)-dependent alcohol dehydrogenase [Phyllobacterium salinisoli]